ncbi:hypothetical protein KCP70_16445 [Salmonella enterica subsp. enterica]|nr:hypothetical protein KCP70_16445 [Salmonella enterica subsp. enterica]
MLVKIGPAATDGEGIERNTEIFRGQIIGANAVYRSTGGAPAINWMLSGLALRAWRKNC